MLVGVGTGWIEEELEHTTGYWNDRGDVLNEWITLLRTVWREKGPVSFDGEYASFDDPLFYPKPANDIPIYTGGISTHRSYALPTVATDGSCGPSVPQNSKRALPSSNSTGASTGSLAWSPSTLMKSREGNIYWNSW